MRITAEVGDYAFELRGGLIHSRERIIERLRGQRQADCQSKNRTENHTDWMRRNRRLVTHRLVTSGPGESHVALDFLFRIQYGFDAGQALRLACSGGEHFA